MNHIFLLVVLAYSSPGSYQQPVIPDGGGGGRWFTGSPVDAFDCSVCHAGGLSLDLEIFGLPVDGWIPGQSYDLAVRWPEPTARVALLAEFARADGSPIGQVELPAQDELLPEERCNGGPRAAKLNPIEHGRTITSLGDCGATLLRMKWTAPAHEDEDAWLFLAGVNSDGSDDPAGDGVFVERIRLPGPASPVAEGCAIGQTALRDGHCRALVLLGLLALTLVRPRRVRVTGLVVLAMIQSACARVQPHQRGRLASPDMQVELDPELCAGRTHAVEYREGSSGGFGGGGGGCGCN